MSLIRYRARSESDGCRIESPTDRARRAIWSAPTRSPSCTSAVACCILAFHAPYVSPVASNRMAALRRAELELTASPIWFEACAIASNAHASTLRSSMPWATRIDSARRWVAHGTKPSVDRVYPCHCSAAARSGRSCDARAIRSARVNQSSASDVSPAPASTVPISSVQFAARNGRPAPSAIAMARDA